MNILLIPIILFSIIIHEYAHGWVAYRLGDPTPKISNRLTLNPVAHIDIWGTIFLPFFIFILSAGHFCFGYAKPVPINPYNFRNPKKDIMSVGIAGPLSNFLLAGLLSTVLKIGVPASLVTPIALGVLFNLILFTFNMIPVPPLDGSKIVASFLSYKQAYRYLKMGNYGFIVLIVLLASGMLQWLITPVMRLLLNILNVGIIY